MPKLTPASRARLAARAAEARRLQRQGLSLREIGAALGVSKALAGLILGPKATDCRRPAGWPTRHTVPEPRDLTGRAFGALVAVVPAGGSGLWWCRCACGRGKKAGRRELLRGRVRSCDLCAPPGTPPPRQPGTVAYDIAGVPFGELTPLWPTGAIFSRSPVWLCQCSCGNRVEYTYNRLSRGTAWHCKDHPEAKIRKKKPNPPPPGAV